MLPVTPSRVHSAMTVDYVQFLESVSHQVWHDNTWSSFSGIA